MIHSPHVQAFGVSNIGNTGGNTGSYNGTWILAGSNNITLNQSTGTNNIHTIYFTGAAGGGGGSINLSAGTTSNNLTNFEFNNSNGVSFGLNGSTITASHNGLTSQSNQALSAGNGSFAFQTATFADSNGVSFSTGTQGIFATVKTDYLTSQSNQALSGSNGSFAFQTATFGNLNGISFYTSNGSMVASHNALTSQSNQAISAGNGSFAFQTATFADSNGVSFSTGTQGIYATVKTDYLTSQSNQALSGSNGSFAFQSATFGNLNGVSFYTSNGSMVASHNGLTSQSNQQLSIYAVSNTTQSSSGTMNASNMSFQGAGIASVGVSNGSIIISVPAGGGAGDGYNILAAGTQTANTATSVVFANSNGISFGMSNSSQITASYTVPSLYTASRWPLYPVPLAASAHINGTTTTTAGGSRTGMTVHVAPFFIHEYVSFNQVMAQISFTGSAGTWSQTGGLMWGLYTDNAGTLSSVSTWMVGHVLSQNSATNYTQNWWWGSNSTSNSSQTSGNVSGSFARSCPVLLATGGSSITPGNYYLVCGGSISSAGGSAGFSFYHISQSLTAMTAGSMWGTNVSSVNDKFLGIHTYTVSSNAAHIMCLPASIASNSISGTGGTSQLRFPVIYFGRTG